MCVCIILNLWYSLFLIIECIRQYAADYVKKHLISSLESKIRLLKLLAARPNVVSNREKILTYDSLSGRQPISQTLLKRIGVSEQEYLQISPAGSVQAADPEESGSKSRRRLFKEQENKKKKSESPPAAASGAYASPNHRQPGSCMLRNCEDLILIHV